MPGGPSCPYGAGSLHRGPAATITAVTDGASASSKPLSFNAVETDIGGKFADCWSFAHAEMPQLYF
jgi:hypothetical protein